MRRSPLPIFVLCLLLATVSGCIEADSAFYLRYDQEKDSFSQLRIFSNIRTSKADELSYLFALTQKKEDVMILPIPGILGPPPAYVRLEGGKIHPLSLSTPPAGFKDKLDFSKGEPFPVDFSTIRIRPGKFFLNEKKNLCYSHEVEVPGKTVDQLILALNKTLSQELPKGMAELIRADADEKLPRITWEQTRKKLSEQIPGSNPPENPNPNGKDQKTRGPFELASLQLIMNAAADEKLNLKRQGARLTFHLPITKGDSKELIATLDHLHATLNANIDKEMKKQEGLPNGTDPKVLALVKGAIKQGFKYKIANQGVAFELDLTAVILVANLLNEDNERVARAALAQGGDAKYQAACRAALTSLKDRGIEILPTLDGKKLRAPYLSTK